MMHSDIVLADGESTGTIVQRLFDPQTTARRPRSEITSTRVSISANASM